MSEDGRTRDVVVEESFPHAPETLWRALTSAELIARWLMPPTGFAAVKGRRFTFKTTPAGAWDGIVHCEILEAIENEHLAFSWKGGDDHNPGYGSRLDTVVSFTLTRVAEGTRLRLIHSGFVVPRNDTALKNLGDGWTLCVGRLGALVGQPRPMPEKDDL